MQAVSASTDLPRQQRQLTAIMAQPDSTHGTFERNIIVSRPINRQCVQRNWTRRRNPLNIQLFPQSSVLCYLPYGFLGRRLPPSHQPVQLRTSMPDVIELRSSNLASARPPMILSTYSSGHGSRMSVHLGKESMPPTPISPPQRLTRERAVSLNTESASLPPKLRELALNSASDSGPQTPELTREQVCLCQPDPKIPRPRNGA